MLFNKDSNGTAELKKLIGYLYADVNFDNLKTDIILAEEEIIRLVGQAVYRRALKHYHSSSFNPDAEDITDNYSSGSGSASGSGEPSDLDDNLVLYIQLPVAINAALEFVKSQDVSHEDTGRKVKIDTDNEKIPFEWMLSRDNANQLRKYYKTVDRLIQFLEDYEDYISEWKDSASQQMARELFIKNAREFNNIYPIDNSRRFFVTILPFIKEAERVYIKPSITDSLYDEIKAELVDGNVSAANRIVLDYINNSLALYSLSIAVKRLDFDAIPECIYQNYITERVYSNNVSAGKGSDALSVKQNLSRSLELDAQMRLANLQDYLTKLSTEAGGETYDPEIEDLETNAVTNKHFRV